MPNRGCSWLEPCDHCRCWRRGPGGEPSTNPLTALNPSVAGPSAALAAPKGEVAIHCAGVGLAVLLLHGWEGQASDMAEFAQRLLAASFAVLAMDLPAHGDSPGTQSSIPHAARALCAAGEKLGPLHAVIAHSMGSPILAEALRAGMSAARVVLISAPASYEHYARGFAAAAGLDAEGTEAMLTRLDETIGVDVRDLKLPHRAQHLRQPALFIHSGDDDIVSIADSLASADAWPGAWHIRVEGLSHQRILADPTVVAAATRFVTAAN